MTSLVTEKGNKDERLADARVVKVLSRRFGVGQWFFIRPGSEKKCILSRTVLKDLGLILRKKCSWNLQKADILLSVNNSIVQGQVKSKGQGKLSIHFIGDDFTIDTIFRIILSVIQLSVYGAVAALCEEFESHQDRSGKNEILMGQSIVLGEVKAEDLLQNDNSMNDQITWQQYIQQVESLSQKIK